MRGAEVRHENIKSEKAQRLGRHNNKQQQRWAT